MALSLNRIRFGFVDVQWAERKNVCANTLTVVDIWRTKTNNQAYGKLICSHQRRGSFKYYNCPRDGCILNVMTEISKRMVLDLLKLAQKGTRCTEAPKRGCKTKRALSF